METICHLVPGTDREPALSLLCFLSVTHTQVPLSLDTDVCERKGTACRILVCKSWPTSVGKASVVSGDLRAVSDLSLLFSLKQQAWKQIWFVLWCWVTGLAVYCLSLFWHSFLHCISSFWVLTMLPKWSLFINLGDLLLVLLSFSPPFEFPECHDYEGRTSLPFTLFYFYIQNSHWLPTTIRKSLLMIEQVASILLLPREKKQQCVEL